MIATIPSATLLGVEGRPVAVEVHVSNGLPGFTLVGHPDPVCREARDRVRAALLSSGLTWPMKRVTVNLAPGLLRKIGPGLDLPIAIGLLVATEELDAEAVAGCAFLGELGLDGSLRRVPGIVPMVGALDARVVVVPVDCVAEAAVVGRLRVRTAGRLSELVACLRGLEPWPDPPRPTMTAGLPVRRPDLADVRGQPVGRTALEISAAGGHHLLLSGPPGAGKTMLARRLPGLLPPLEGDDALVATTIRSAAGEPLPPAGLVVEPPFRAPHHGASAVALIGGGTAWMRPGEISQAHLGVLFLDEMAEFPRTVLDALRQPLEEGVVRVSRARASVAFPARFLLVGATNPCPCGDAGPEGACRCSEAVRQRYNRRLSGPLLDRFDLRVVMSRPGGGPPAGGTAGGEHRGGGGPGGGGPGAGPEPGGELQRRAAGRGPRRGGTADAGGHRHPRAPPPDRRPERPGAAPDPAGRPHHRRPGRRRHRRRRRPRLPRPRPARRRHRPRGSRVSRPSLSAGPGPTASAAASAAAAPSAAAAVLAETAAPPSAPAAAAAVLAETAAPPSAPAAIPGETSPPPSGPAAVPPAAAGAAAPPSTPVALPTETTPPPSGPAAVPPAAAAPPSAPEVVPAEAFVAALAGLPAMGHRRLVALLGRWSPEEAWRRVGDGRGHDDDSDVAELWRQAAAKVDVEDLWLQARAGRRGCPVLRRPRLPGRPHRRP